MICGVVSTVTVYLTSLWWLRSARASTNTLSVAESCFKVALIAAESPLCGDVEHTCYGTL